jgi:hypothetical protein
MATVTPNFNWPVPTSTDLVKDGATAIEALGDSIDASLVDLKGGTTGQVLAKASGTDMDFNWVAQDDSNAIQNSIVDAKGDLIAASANDTPARLAVGANGETLVADSSATTGLRYQAPVNVNPVLNSAFQVWQRGTSISIAASTAAASGYSADRWDTATGANQAITISRQTTSDTTNLPFIQYCARYQRNSGQTGTGALTFAQNFESINSIQYAGKTVTFSFYGRAGANYSATSNALNVYIWNGTGTDQNVIGAGFTGQNAFINSSATLTTTWQRFTFTATVPTNATQIATGLSFTPTGTASTNDYFEVTGVQLEVGSVATPFKTYAGTIQGELAACQRYYWRSGNTSVFAAHGNGYASTTAVADFVIVNPVPMRVGATSVEFSTLAVFDGVNAIAAITTVTLQQTSNRTTTISTGGSSGLTIYRPYTLLNNNNAAGYLAASAEL